MISIKMVKFYHKTEPCELALDLPAPSSTMPETPYQQVIDPPANLQDDRPKNPSHEHCKDLIIDLAAVHQ